MIKNDLLVTSDYHRVLIFCDKDTEGNVAGLNQLNFQADVANALLKTFEEPPKDSCIILLTSTFDALPATILSRALKIQLPNVE